MCSCMHISLHIRNCRCVTRGSHSAFTEVELVTLAVTAVRWRKRACCYICKIKMYTGDITRWRKDINFMFEWEGTISNE